MCVYRLHTNNTHTMYITVATEKRQMGKNESHKEYIYI